MYQRCHVQRLRRTFTCVILHNLRAMTATDPFTPVGYGKRKLLPRITEVASVYADDSHFCPISSCIKQPSLTSSHNASPRNIIKLLVVCGSASLSPRASHGKKLDSRPWIVSRPVGSARSRSARVWLSLGKGLSLVYPTFSCGL